MTSFAQPHDVLAVDIGATNIKYAHVSLDGVLRDSVHRRRTPYPCTPDRLVQWLALRIEKSPVRQVAIGFPGECSGGRVVRPGNLSRRTGVGSDVDPAIDDAWRDFPLSDVIRERTSRDVRVVNDATLAALGCVGESRELLVSLGTGCGVALFDQGEPVPIEDLGAVEVAAGLTYDEAVGERARMRDVAQWERTVGDVLVTLVARWRPQILHVAGGNAKRLSPRVWADVPCEVVIQGNDAALRGAARLFRAV